MEILPGEITDPAWSGPRCAVCARPVGGDGSMWRTCDDVPQAHASMDSIPKATKDKFFVGMIWSNCQQMLPLLDAIGWMADHMKAIKDGEYGAVLEEQHGKWPQTAQQVAALRR